MGPIFDGNAYVCFSDFCTLDLYRRYYADIPYVKTWSETENELRKLIKCYLSERYSNNWEHDMQNYLTNNPPFRGFNVSIWSANVQKLKNNQQDMISNFPSLNGNHIVDFTLTSQLFDIFIKWDWGWFGNVFPGYKTDWYNRFDHLTKVRNPVAHNNPGNIQSEIDLAKTYCTEIKEMIDSWKLSRKNATS